MFCIQESEPPHSDPFSDKDPLSQSVHSDSSSEDEPQPKRIKTYDEINSLNDINSLNLKVYKIPAYNTPKSLSIFPTTTSTLPSLPKFVNNPLNLANPLAIATNNLQTQIQNASNLVKNLQSRYSLPSKLTITPVQSPKPTVDSTGEPIRYKKNGEIAKKRGPPKGSKRKPKDHTQFSQSFTHGSLLQSAQNTLLTTLLAAANTSLASLATVATPDHTPVTPKFIPRALIPKGVELVELELDPEDWFPAEPYKMSFSRKKNPKWKNFPYRCEHCFKGYRVASTLLQHSAERHGTIPRELAVPCPCCPHVSTRRKHHKKHLETHESRKHRLFCAYCIPAPDPTKPYEKESVRFPYDEYPQYWYASEESLRLHKKRKHPYAAMFNYNWFGTWGDSAPNM